MARWSYPLALDTEPTNAGAMRTTTASTLTPGSPVSTWRGRGGARVDSEQPLAAASADVGLPSLGQDRFGPEDVTASTAVTDLHTQVLSAGAHWYVRDIPEDTLDLEYRTFLAHRSQFIAEHPDKHVLIKRDRIVGFYDTRRDALVRGITVFGDVPFFIAELGSDDDGSDSATRDR